MTNTYIVENKKLSDLLEDIDSFKTKINTINDNYNSQYHIEYEVHKDDNSELWIGTITANKDE
tara:strand:+ start:5076 stop:5264 length:189 start_codon:yes stop_codon:yes gene_type:complete